MNTALQSDPLDRAAQSPRSGLVAVAMSGGVDSSVVAALLQEQNHSVVGLTMQLWTLWDKQKGPVSVGLIDRTHSARFERADLPQQNDQIYEITLEQVGGSPTGRPTGPVLVKGYATTPR